MLQQLLNYLIKHFVTLDWLTLVLHIFCKNYKELINGNFCMRGLKKNVQTLNL